MKHHTLHWRWWWLGSLLGDLLRAMGRLALLVFWLAEMLTPFLLAYVIYRSQ